MSALSHILTSHAVQSKGCYLYRNTLNPASDGSARYVVGGACESLIIGTEVHGASNIYRTIEEWLSDNEENNSPVVGVRVDPYTYDVYVDLCTLTPLRSIAILRARERGEGAIWDLVDNVAIPVPKDMTWRELAAKISSLPDEVMDSSALVFDGYDISHQIEDLTPYNSDDPVSITNPPSIDLRSN